MTSLISDDPELIGICGDDDNFKNLSVSIYNRASASDALSLADSTIIRDTEIETIAAVLSDIHARDKKFQSHIADLRDAGYYSIYDSLPDPEFIKAAFRQDAEGINRVIRVYGKAETPHYAGIDSISFDIKSREFFNLMVDIRSCVLKTKKQSEKLLGLPIEVALNLLEANDRPDAAMYEPLKESTNKAAADAAAGIVWDNYPYSAILVPGSGPSIPDQAISPLGRQRCKYAAMLYKEGKAPFLIVSGGSVHPRLTPYNEAIEMRRYLVSECGIPESAIFAEPHARHTTTNIRNTVRIMKSCGFPMERKALISSSSFQLDYIMGEKFHRLCKKMMLAVPFRLCNRISDRELEFIPLGTASQVNPIDPMDP